MINSDTFSITLDDFYSEEMLNHWNKYHPEFTAQFSSLIDSDEEVIFPKNNSLVVILKIPSMRDRWPFYEKNSKLLFSALINWISLNICV